MKKVIINLAVVALSLSFVTTAQAQLRFKDYPVKVYKGKKATIEIPSPMYDEPIRNPSVDFAGLYHVAGIGCGTACMNTLFYGVRTGKMYPFSDYFGIDPFVGCKDGSSGDIAYRPNSRLLVVKGGDYGKSNYYANNVKCEVRYFVEKNGKLIRIK